MTLKIKTITCVLLFCFMFNIISLAASVSITEKSVDEKTGEVKLSGMLESDGHMKELGLSVYDENNNICGIYQSTAEENGKFDFDFFLNKSGLYYIGVAHYECVGGANEKIYYADSDEISNVLEQFKSASSKALTSLFDLYSKDGEKPLLEIETDSFYHKNSDIINSLILKYISDVKNLGDIENLYDKSFGFVKVNISSAENLSENIEKYAGLLGLSTDDEYYKKLRASICELFLNYRKEGFGDFVSLSDAFDDAKAVAAVNCGARDTADKIMEDFSDVFEKHKTGFSGTIKKAYAEFSAVELNKAVTDKDFSDIDAVISRFEERYNELKNQSAGDDINYPHGGGFGGGSGGNSGGIGVNKSNISVEKTTEKNENEEKSSHAKFKDIENVEWAAEAINYLAEKNIISGVGGDLFEPERNVTREEFLKMLVVLLDEDPVYENIFSDVEKSGWSYPYIGAAYKKGLVSGKPDGSFGIGEYISRQDAAVMLYNAAALNNIRFEENISALPFEDGKDVADYAKKAVYNMFKIGIVKGAENNMFYPLGKTTRAEAAVMIYRLSQSLR